MTIGFASIPRALSRDPPRLRPPLSCPLRQRRQSSADLGAGPASLHARALWQRAAPSMTAAQPPNAAPPASGGLSLASFFAVHSLLSAAAAGLNSKAKRLALRVLRQGPVPEHIAFIMDGNRRFAQSHGAHAAFGHLRGFEKLEEILEWCFRLGVRVATVYAFSIENFKRPKDEVAMLMSLLKEKLDFMCEKSDIINSNGVQIRVVGDISLLPKDVQEAARRAEEITQKNGRTILNVCCPYTSREEITAAVRTVAERCANNELDPSEFGELDIERLLRTKDSPPVDILVRTSGEIRLSDFMLWQSSDSTEIHFLRAFWPSLSVWHLVPLILSYQHHRTLPWRPPPEFVAILDSDATATKSHEKSSA